MKRYRSLEKALRYWARKKPKSFNKFARGVRKTHKWVFER